MRRIALLLTACTGANLPFAAQDDYDRDGVPNAEDCAPYDADVSGDRDGDGWYDVRCTASSDDTFVLVDPDAHLDCDDDDGTVHPEGEWGAPVYWERAPSFDAYDGAVAGSEVCAWLDGLHQTDPLPRPLTEAATDGVDND
ncbi:MAG: hypothetical protein ACI9K2_007615, partial [Myxococcota bacterium]